MRDRLARLVPRAERADVRVVETLLLDPSKEAAALADLVGRLRCRPRRRAVQRIGNLAAQSGGALAAHARAA